jgi:RimJ/RimL family protein N-acetyltransferase
VAGSPDPAVSWLNWVIRLRDEDCLVGYVQATIGPAAGAPGEAGETHKAGDVAEIAWVVGSAWQRRGIAAEAAVGLVGWLAEQPVRTVIAHIHPKHSASAAVASATGLAATDQGYDGEIRWQREIRQ